MKRIPTKLIDVLLRPLYSLGLAVVLGLVLVPLAFAVPGDLDATFSGDGKAVVDFTSGDDFALSVVVQPDGSIVAAGHAGGPNHKFALTRYNAEGTLDTSFGGDGKVTTDFTSGDDWAWDVAVQANGKIVAAGRAAGSRGRFALTRYNADGTLDTSFGGDGRVATNFTARDDVARAVVIQPDGKIVAAGSARGLERFAVARYNADGTLDTSFGSDGKITTNLTAGFDVANGIALQPGGEIVTAGSADDDMLFALARYNADGTLDTSFGGDGKLTTNFTSGLDFAWDVAVQPEGAIVAAGRAGGRFGLARYNADGTLDTSFGGDGKVVTDFSARFDVATGIALQPGGEIVAAGSASADAFFALARYNSDGTLDTSFSGDGKLTTDFTSGVDFAWDVAVQANGKIVAAGRAGRSGGRFALARYLGS